MNGNIGIFLMCYVFQAFFPEIVEGSSKMDVGLKFNPRINDDSTLIRIKRSGGQRNFEEWSRILTDYLRIYNTPLSATAFKNCDYKNSPNIDKDVVCDVYIIEFGVCNKEYYYGYHKSQPCIFLELDKNNGWIPEYYNNTDDLPSEMPEDLKYFIKNNITKLEERNNVWVSCAGETPTDVEYLGPIQYFPSIRGFPGYYYPYSDSKKYLSPLVAVQFQRVTAGIVLNVECRAWAKNLNYDYDKSGSVHFELLID